MRPVPPPLPKLIVIVGPTATGKTDLALTLAGRLGGDIISADSMQVYRGMDIGTAKPSPEERTRIRHHLLDVVDPDEPFNAVRFAEEADAVIQALLEHKNPIWVVGGTGLYIRALLRGLFPGPPANESLREFYRRQQERYGPDHLYQTLQAVDSLAAGRIAPQDHVRIIRALEVMALTGRSIVDRQTEHGFHEKRYDYLKIGLSIDRTDLYERIDRRTHAMMQSGLVDETQRLLEQGYDEDLRPMQSLGYKHVASHLKGNIGLDEAVALTARDTRRYAKRQGTWFRAEPDISWFSPKEYDKIENIVENFLTGCNREFA